jgi:hypothetical protein
LRFGTGTNYQDQLAIPKISVEQILNFKILKLCTLKIVKKEGRSNREERVERVKARHANIP